jgi:hypothetical protein
MSRYVEHHTLALLSCNTAALELLSTQPETDAICELRDLLEAQFDIIDCIIQNRHFGSDGLDSVIEQCNSIVAQVKEFEES